MSGMWVIPDRTDGGKRMKTLEEMEREIIKLILDNPKDPALIAKKLCALLTAWH
jgi:hypothetical protein